MDDIFKPVFQQDSSIGFITGRRGSGKTDFCLLLLEEGKTEGYWDRIASNSGVYNDPSVDYICYFDRLEDWLKIPGKKAFFLDELGSHLYRMSFMSKKARIILELCQLIRHYDAHLVGAAPSEDLINKLFFSRDLLDYRMKKLSRKIAYVKTYEPYPNHTKVFDLPRTSILFKTKHIATFDLVDPTKGKEEFRGKPIEEQAVLLYAKHHNLRTVAQILGVSHTSVATYLKKVVKKANFT